jgi:HAD superfamily hydrolase (TIGR01549 family)
MSHLHAKDPQFPLQSGDGGLFYNMEVSGEIRLIKAVFFDLDDTLYDQLQSFKLALAAADLSPAVDGPDALERLYTGLRRHSDRLWTQHVRGEMTLEELRIERGISAFADEGTVLTRERARLLQSCYEREQGRLELRPEALPLLERLQQNGTIVGLITNGPVAHQMGKITALGLERRIPPQRIFISDGLGFAKPDLRVFAHVQQQAGLLPEELMYVGDAWHNDIAPSYRSGWSPVWLNCRGQKPVSGDAAVRFQECGTMAEAAELVLAACVRQK